MDDLITSSERETTISPPIRDAEILLLSSKGNLEQDLAAIRRVRSASPELLILLIGVTGGETNFLQCIRAGFRGYLPQMRFHLACGTGDRTFRSDMGIRFHNGFSH